MVSSGRRKFIIRRFDNVMPRKNALPQAKSSMVTGSLGITQSSGLDRHAVYAMTTSSFIQVEKNQSPVIMARDYKDPNVVCPAGEYAVRRLTPTECARLQGFPDQWCADLAAEAPSEDELAFWREVWDTYSRVTGGGRRTDKQILKWLRDPYTDSAEYKMWGNGVALPCVWFVLCGIVWYAQSCGE